MRLISLHIENFGVFSDYTFLFRDGVNNIVHENGWGKSTLAAFIRVMFYGFDNESKRSELENERKKFFPWQGGTCGGMIVFNANGKNYRLERSFNEKKGGTFVIYDGETNLETKDFSENIGEELFGIDAASFERTVFIGQQDCSTQATSAINAKIGNIGDNTADMGQYEEVQTRLKKEADSLSPLRKTGAIMRLKDDIAAKESLITGKERLTRHREEIIAQINRLHELKAENTKRTGALREDMKRLSVLKDRAAKRSEYDRLKKSNDEAEEKYRNLMEDFGGKEPDEAELRDIMQKAGQLSSYDQIMKDFRLNENEKRDEERIYDEYPDGFPEDEEIVKLLSLNNESGVKKNALASKKANLKLMISMNERERADAGAERKRGFVIGVIFLFAALFLIIAGTFFVSSTKEASLGFFAAGLIAGILGLIRLLRNKKYVPPEDNTYLELEEDIASDEKFIEKTDEAVSAFLKKLSKERPADDDLNGLFEKVREDKRKSAEYSKRREKFDEAHKQRDDLIKEINAFLTSCGFDKTTDPTEALETVNTKARELKEAKKALEESQNHLMEFEEANDTEELEEDIELPGLSMEELNERLDGLQNENEGFLDKIKQYEDELDGCDEELSDIELNEEQLLSMKERLKELQYRYDIICDTRDYLERAKASFSAKYMEPIKRAFDKYYSVLSCDDTKEYELDANLNLRLINRGISRDTAFLSGGFQDLVGLCRRMAMIEAMYKEETPFLIFDDPFVNLDNDRVRAGVNILKRISDNYQIIYFTCHESREVRS